MFRCVATASGMTLKARPTTILKLQTIATMVTREVGRCHQRYQHGRFIVVLVDKS
jgi:hypothetical protein